MDMNMGIGQIMATGSSTEPSGPPTKPYGEIYVLTCTVTGKQYVGQTIQGMMKRWVGHCSDARRTTSLQTKIQIDRAIHKYGADAFTLKVIDTAVTPDELHAKEIHWIEVLGTRTSGYNTQRGGGLSPEAIEKCRQSHLGRKLSPEHIEKCRQANLGRKMSLEAIAKIRQARLGQKRSPEAIEKSRQANLGRKQSPEHIEKCRQARLGRKLSLEHIEKIR